MTNAEAEALAVNLERMYGSIRSATLTEAAAAIRALAGEVERLRLDAKQAGEATEKMHASWSPLVVLNERLRAEVAALRKDAERLDALEKNWDKWGVDSYAKDPSKFGLWRDGDTTDGNEYAGLRAAIDAALADKPLPGTAS